MAVAGVDRLSTALATTRLRLLPTEIAHAAALAVVLEDPGLHRHIGGSPRTVDEWSAQLARWAARTSPDGSQVWLNWVVVMAETGQVVGWLQATVYEDQADIAFMVGAPWQGHGFAREASFAVVDHLRANGIMAIGASIGPQNGASQGVATRLGMTRTGAVDDDGEERWELPARPAPRMDQTLQSPD